MPVRRFSRLFGLGSLPRAPFAQVYLRRLSLTHFRCYRKLDLTLPSGTIVLVGRNAQGKTSLLEACYVLATTRSPLTSTDRELIHWQAMTEEVLPFSRAWGEVALAGGLQSIEVVNMRQAIERGEERYVKRFRVNNAPRRAMDVLGILNVVLFTPRDIDLVDGAPSGRRLYLDVFLCQIDRAYCAALARYNRVLTQRNHLLRRLRDRGGQKSELAFWNAQLIEDGALLIERRLWAVTELGALAAEVHGALVGSEGLPGNGLLPPGKPGQAGIPGAYAASSPPRVPVETGLVVSYRSTVLGAAGADEDTQRGARPFILAEPTLPYGSGTPGENAAVPLSRADLSAAYAEVLAKRQDEELARGMTLAGPHRDDLSFAVHGVDMRTYGSRGQQRTVVLALKLAEARLMWTATGERPVLLLDDVLSELDQERRQFLLDHIDAHQQTIVTTTDIAQLPAAFLSGAMVLTVEGGTIVEAKKRGQASALG